MFCGLVGVRMNEAVDVVVGRRLRARRRLLGLTQHAVACACGVRFQQIQKYECAANRMSANMLWKLACVLDVDIAYFFVGLPREHDEAADERRAFASLGLTAEPANAGA